MKKALVIILLAVMFTFPGLQVSSQTAESWREDIKTLVTLIEDYHPNPWQRISFNEFAGKEDLLLGNLRGWTNEKVILEIQKLVASISDGHTQVLLDNQDLFAYWLPVRIEEFSDGFFVTAATMDYDQLIGSRVLRIGEYSTDDAADMVGEIISADSQQGKRMRIANYLTNLTILQTLGISKPRYPVDIIVVANNGIERKFTLQAKLGTTNFNWAYNRKSLPIQEETVSVLVKGKKELPLYLAGFIGNTEPFWYEHLAADSILYLQINSIFNSGRELLSDFIGRTLEYYCNNLGSIHKLVIDLRFNNGGNGDIIPSVVDIFSSYKEFINRSELFIITGKETFSAGSILIGQLQKTADFIVVGDIAPGPLNFSSDPVMFRLPNTGLLVNISRLYSQDGHPMDDRGYFPPDYYIPFPSDDYFSFRDPVMDAIKLKKVRSLKEILYNEGVEPFREELKIREEENGPAINWFPYTAYDLSLYTLNVLIADGKYEEALEMASLNTSLYPGSIWGWFISGMIFSNIGNYEEARNCFRTLLEIEPCHQEALWEMEKLYALQTPFKPDPTVMNELVGEYEGRSVLLEDGILKFQTGTGKKRNLIPVNDYRYIPEGSNIRVVFEISGGKALRMKSEQWDGTTNIYGKSK